MSIVTMSITNREKIKSGLIINKWSNYIRILVLFIDIIRIKPFFGSKRKIHIFKQFISLIKIVAFFINFFIFLLKIDLIILILYFLFIFIGYFLIIFILFLNYIIWYIAHLIFAFNILIIWVNIIYFIYIVLQFYFIFNIMSMVLHSKIERLIFSSLLDHSWIIWNLFDVINIYYNIHIISFDFL